MKPSNKTSAQARADRVHAFSEELAELEGDGVLSLSAEQRRALADYHSTLIGELAEAFDIDRSQEDRQLSIGMRIASFLGALALAASVFFLFYQFWGLLNTPVQLAILIGAPLVLFSATIVTARIDHSGYFVKLIALVAFACFVLNVSMLGMIFNITPSDNALIPWAALAFLLAYALDVRLLLVAGILCVIAFVSARTGTIGGMYWLSFGERPENFLPAGLLLFCAPALINHARFAGFAGIYRIFGLLTIFLPILVLSNWGGASYLPWKVSFIEAGYQLAGFALSALVIWFGVRKHWASVVNTGNTFFVIFLYTKFYDWWWEVMPKYLFFLIIALTAILFLFVFRRLRGTDQMERA